MTTILFIFIANLIFGLFLTPMVRKLGIKVGALDLPDDRKIHDKPIPRIGGFGLFLAFILTIILIHSVDTKITELFKIDRKTIYFILGAATVFGIGLADDFHRVPPSAKLLFQIIGASLAFLGGLRIDAFYFFALRINFGPLDYFLTIFWFVLFINAINLIDGLDGLATGIVLFISVLMTVFSIVRQDYLPGMIYACIAGGTLGFLRYNFRPATIFLGDGGSYFLGYMVAGLAIIGSAKSQVGAIFLIPLVALGVPLMDTLLSPLRRFSIGKRMLSPDGDHIHHRLLKLGFSIQNSVLIIYGITLALCTLAILLVNLRNEMVGLFLLIIGVGTVFSFKMLGYSDYFIGSTLSDRLEDFSDDLGLGSGRRSFFNLLNGVMGSVDFEQLWQNITKILEALEFDKGSMYLNDPIKQKRFKERKRIAFKSENPDRRKMAPLNSSVILRKTPPELDWVKPPFAMENYVCSRSILRIEMPLLGKENAHFGTIVLVKDTKAKPINHQTLRRVEDLRRTVARKLEAMAQDTNSKKPPQSHEDPTTNQPSTTTCA